MLLVVKGQGHGDLTVSVFLERDIISSALTEFFKFGKTIHLEKNNELIVFWWPKVKRSRSH